MGMKLLGAHLSVAKGIDTVQKQMEELRSDTCALFLKNQRRFVSKPIDPQIVASFKKVTKSPEVLVPHGSYLVNLANEATLEKSYACLVDDMERCDRLGILYYNIHPGSDVNKMGEGALRLIAKQLNKAIGAVPRVVVLLENMAGQGTVCGKTFEELACIIKHIEDKNRIGVTLDTCHMFAAGYDIRTADSFDKVMHDFDRIVGHKYLKAVHLNDSKFPLGARRDRHEHIGKGHIGIEAFRYIMNSHYFDNIPMVLETPEPDEYKNEIKLLRSLIE